MKDFLKYVVDPEHRKKRLYERSGNYLEYLKNPLKIYFKHKAEGKAREICATPEVRGIAKRISSYEGEYKKYRDLKRYIKMNLRRIYELGLDKKTGLQILDIGSGAGFFSFLARKFGHTSQGLDLPFVEIFNILIKEFNVPRWECSIDPQTPITINNGRKFDLIVAYAICFHMVGDRVWTREDWHFFLNDVKNNLIKPRGKMRLWFNNYPHGDYEDVKNKVLDSGLKIKLGHKTIDIYF
ncbi:class I SAM-dependent methyltransferase [Maridesulfovibrio sp. FT414]|uniref:class I SAM-dependent methyltransferase n=1 Tax=Maridesulfovibrio sp. FT414 TaxID=2979469 RepID=UPI003D807215